jgi:hypothetical protein
LLAAKSGQPLHDARKLLAQPGTIANRAADVQKSVIAPSYLEFGQGPSGKSKQIQEICALVCEAATWMARGPAAEEAIGLSMAGCS